MSGYLNDLLVFDYPSMTWSDISGVITGVKPAEKYGFGFLVQDGKLYVHGGANSAGKKKFLKFPIFFLTMQTLC
jgi:hypothetical protein